MCRVTVLDQNGDHHCAVSPASARQALKRKAVHIIQHTPLIIQLRPGESI